MKILLTKKLKEAFGKMTEILKMNEIIRQIDEEIYDCIIYNDITGKTQRNFERRRIIEKRNELIEALKNF